MEAHMYRNKNLWRAIIFAAAMATVITAASLRTPL
jgi:hypothetical protein